MKKEIILCDKCGTELCHQDYSIDIKYKALDETDITRQLDYCRPCRDKILIEMGLESNA